MCSIGGESFHLLVRPEIGSRKLRHENATKQLDNFQNYGKSSQGNYFLKTFFLIIFANPVSNTPVNIHSARLPPSADDHQALIWDIQQMPRAIEDPILAYTAEGEINNVQWASTQPDWIAICYNNCLEILRV